MGCEAKTDWNLIKAEYIAGGTSYRKLAEKYEISKTVLERKAKAEKWPELRRQAEDKATTKILNVVSTQMAKVDADFDRIVNKLMKKAEKAIDKIPAGNIKSIKEAATALKYLKECKGIKSEADAREQEARIKNLEKNAERGDDGGVEINVTFGSENGEDASAWAE